MDTTELFVALQKRLDEQDVPTPRYVWIGADFPDFYAQLVRQEREKMDKVEAAIEQARRQLDEMALPESMTPDEAIQFYQAIAAHCDGSIDALESEET